MWRGIILAALLALPAQAQYTGPCCGMPRYDLGNPPPLPHPQVYPGPPVYPRERFNGSIGNAQQTYPPRQRQCMTNCSYNRCFTSCF
jgi:hypothetical protein